VTVSADERVLSYLAGHNVMTLATIGTGGPWAAAVFYANVDFRLIFLSSAKSRHVRNIASHSIVAATVQEDYSDWNEIQGVQLEGSARELRGDEREEGVRVYREKFPGVLDSEDVAIRNALARVSWFELTASRLFFVDNSRGFGHRDEILVEGS